MWQFAVAKDFAIDTFSPTLRWPYHLYPSLKVSMGESWPARGQVAHILPAWCPRSQSPVLLSPAWPTTSRLYYPSLPAGSCLSLDLPLVLVRRDIPRIELTTDDGACHL